MGITTNFKLPYPEQTDPADVPADIKRLADAVDLLNSGRWWGKTLGVNANISGATVTVLSLTLTGVPLGSLVMVIASGSATVLTPASPPQIIYQNMVSGSGLTSQGANQVLATATPNEYATLTCVGVFAVTAVNPVVNMNSAMGGGTGIYGANGTYINAFRLT